MRSSRLLLSIFSVLFLFVGCGGGSSSSPTDEDPIFPDAVEHNASFTSDHFSGSQNCARCHDGLTDENRSDVSIHKAWQSTIMSNAAIDPFWKAKVASEVKRNPHVQGVIEEKCARCHTPMASVEAGFSGDPVTLLGDGFLNPENPHYDAAMNGVSCTLCHQISNTAQLGTVDGFSGGFEIADERMIYGPYQDINPNPMINNVNFTPLYSAHMMDSKHCATCHDLDTPVLHPDGELAGISFPEQAPYREWEYSEYNGTKHCQSCHMPVAEGGVVISTRPDNGTLAPQEPFHQHKFIGANTYMLNIIKNNKVKLGAIADDASFDQTITNNRAFLQASADVEITPSDYSDGKLSFSVKVTNHSGHKFPTSIPTRRTWLHVTVKDAENTTVFESGALAPDGRQIIGVDDNPNQAYEPHYEKIVDPSEVQVYEGIMADTEDNVTYTLLNAAQFVKDNRIMPRGMDKTAVPETIKAYGAADTDPNFIGGSDTVDYEIALAASSSYTVNVTLMYQTLAYGFAQDLYKDDDLTEVALMKYLDEQTKLHSEEVSADQAVIPLLR
ncbi:cytochrome c family protein [Sulfurovum mangrovi]|uniref:cytochrome c family protein n=1 Tax=Sulfurovum mangrovi TaxID=2893889 RepID=UPI001E29DF39|nr:cytochrome c family protein [Sulfurovum mangrovi]UFH59768.1 cytochrome c family protein [Sulfurovum mangrovi]UFH60570.1 cytochrome c family protein [Sulfurovum mangrovi]